MGSYVHFIANKCGYLMKKSYFCTAKSDVKWLLKD